MNKVVLSVVCRSKLCYAESKIESFALAPNIAVFPVSLMRHESITVGVLADAL